MGLLCVTTIQWYNKRVTDPLKPIYLLNQKGRKPTKRKEK